VWSGMRAPGGSTRPARTSTPTRRSSSRRRSVTTRSVGAPPALGSRTAAQPRRATRRRRRSVGRPVVMARQRGLRRDRAAPRAPTARVAGAEPRTPTGAEPPARVFERPGGRDRGAPSSKNVANDAMSPLPLLTRTKQRRQEPEGGRRDSAASTPGRVSRGISAGNDSECRREREVAVHGIDTARLERVGTHS
jgi:hypothetical protein